MSAIELLAPAGTVDTYFAALDGGADAVYVGAPGFNARNLSRDLSIEEIGAMIHHCHDLGKKIYIAANSLILERELKQVIHNLALLNELQPDALIIQDLGLFNIVKNYFPNLKLHGSTLMTVHNSEGVQYLGDQGCERVVLARELTLKEIDTISTKIKDVELEIFIHGAMCFSYSGLCLFSSYLGGKSGLRGRCVQPCRRSYTSGGSGGKGGGSSSRGSRGKEKKGGSGKYLFSMNDLTGLEAIADLKRLGISSLKIEGRLRSAHYVRSVVSAYRHVIDAGESVQEQDQALTEAKELVDQSMSRKTSTGYFFSPQPVNAITPHHSGNMGIHVGKFSTIKSVSGTPVCRFVIKTGLEVGDRLRLHIEPSGERKAFRLKTLFITGNKEQRAGGGTKVSIELPDDFSLAAGSFVDVYKVDGVSKRKAHHQLLDKKRVSEKIHKLNARSARQTQSIAEFVTGAAVRVQEAQEDGSQENRGASFKGRQRTQRKSRKKLPLEWWIKCDSIKMLLGQIPFKPDRYLLTFEKQMLRQAGKIKSGLGKRSRLVSWVLPPLIMENDLVRVKKQIRILLRTGFRSFQIGHVSQIRLFKNERVHLFGDYSLNVMNNRAALQLQEQGVDEIQAAIELDKQALGELLAGCRAVAKVARAEGASGGSGHIPVGLYVYGAPPLYTSRLASKHFSFEQKIESPRKEPYIIRKKEGFTQTFPESPLSLLPYLEELKEAGVSYVVVDTCGHSSKKEMEELTERLVGSGRYRKLPTFNYLGSLE